jgi:hypothetical protein
MGIKASAEQIREWVEKGLIPPQGDPRPAAEGGGRKPPSPERPKRKTRSVVLATSARWVVILYPACRVVTEANTHEHWAVQNRRKQKQRAAIGAALREMQILRGQVAPHWRPPVPCAVTMTHVGPRMDDDNLARAFKSVRDYLAGWIGVDDGDDRVRWLYDQKPGKPGVEIRIEGKEPT